MDLNYQLQSKRIERNVLEEELEEADLWDCDRYQHLQQQIEQLESALEDGDREQRGSRAPDSATPGTD
jgi:hypothetical protein